MVYGWNATIAASLRLPDGHMKMSAGGYLPIAGGMFVAGDPRAAENPALTALQTLFVREHNYQVDKLHKEHPHWSGDKLYDYARAIVTAEIANITYSEFLPNLLGADTLDAYTAISRMSIRTSRSSLPLRRSGLGTRSCRAKPRGLRRTAT